eukprot:11157282-Lingulodinium_polyedra.AAC.1
MAPTWPANLASLVRSLVRETLKSSTNNARGRALWRAPMASLASATALETWPTRSSKRNCHPLATWSRTRAAPVLPWALLCSVALQER